MKRETIERITLEIDDSYVDRLDDEGNRLCILGDEPVTFEDLRDALGFFKDLLKDDLLSLYRLIQADITQSKETNHQE